MVLYTHHAIFCVCNDLSTLISRTHKKEPNIAISRKIINAFQGVDAHISYIYVCVYLCVQQTYNSAQTQRLCHSEIWMGDNWVTVLYMVYKQLSYCTKHILLAIGESISNEAITHILVLYKETCRKCMPLIFTILCYISLLYFISNWWVLLFLITDTSYAKNWKLVGKTAISRYTIDTPLGLTTRFRNPEDKLKVNPESGECINKLASLWVELQRKQRFEVRHKLQTNQLYQIPIKQRITLLIFSQACVVV